MSISCIEGSACRPRGAARGMPPLVHRFEESVVRRYFETTLDAWKGEASYHTYANVSLLSTDLPLATVWQEYLHWPAPTVEGRRDEPVRTGDHSFAAGAPHLVLGLPVPMVGGWVVHFVDQAAHALITATTPWHVLHPGYVLRWLSHMGPGIVSNTVGRGVGMMPHINESVGIRIFHELDESIRDHLAQ